MDSKTLALCYQTVPCSKLIVLDSKAVVFTTLSLSCDKGAGESEVAREINSKLNYEYRQGKWHYMHDTIWEFLLDSNWASSGSLGLALRKTYHQSPTPTQIPGMDLIGMLGYSVYHKVGNCFSNNFKP